MRSPTRHSIILMYHRLREDLPADPAEWIYTVSPARFLEQLDLLVGGRVSVPPLGALAGGDLPDRSVFITFDDGADTDSSLALPALRARGLSAAFFLNPALLGQPGYLDWEEARALLAAGMEVGSHGLDHSLLDHLSHAEVEHQLKASKELLEEKLGRRIELLSLPGGSGGRRAARIARALGYRLVLGSRPGRVPLGLGPPVLPRYAVRRGESLEHFRGLVEQRPGACLRQALRYRAAHLARATLGRAGYDLAKKKVFRKLFPERRSERWPRGAG